MAVSGVKLQTALAGLQPPITVIGDMRHVPGYANDLWFLDSSAGPVVVKIRRIPEEDPEQIRTYARSMALLEDEGFPTPDLLVMDEACAALDGRQLCILRHCDGVVAAEHLARASHSTQATLFRELGRTIGQLHSVDLPPDTVWRDDRGEEHADWLAVVMSSLDEARSELAGRITGEPDQMINTAVQRIEHEAPRILAGGMVPRLVHRDLHLGNVLVEDGRVTALLDFEMVREWDPAYDFVKINSSIFKPHPGVRAPFLAGYRERAPTPDDFERRIDLYEGLYCLLAAVDYLDGNEQHRHWHQHLQRWLAPRGGN